MNAAVRHILLIGIPAGTLAGAVTFVFNRIGVDPQLTLVVLIAIAGAAGVAAALLEGRSER